MISIWFLWIKLSLKSLQPWSRKSLILSPLLPLILMDMAAITLIICVVTIVVIIIMVRLCARLTRTHGICCGASCCKQTGSSGAGSGPTWCAACGALSCTKCVASCHICCRIVCEEIDDSDVEEIHFNLSVFQCVFLLGDGDRPMCATNS